MLEAWLIEIAKAIGKLFLNPLLYWSILLVLLAGYRRIKKERMDFGIKIFDAFSEWKNTWVLSIVFGLSISVLTLVAGMVFSYESILLLSIVMIVLSILGKFTLLSASYTVGVTYLLILFLPFILENQAFVDTNLFSQNNFTSFTILLGMFLIVEGILLSQIKRKETYPELVLGNRGVWVGQHHLKKVSIIPFFVLVPAGLITPFSPFWPYFSIGEESYSLLLMPFLIGFDHIVKGNSPRQAATRLANEIILLGILVILIAVSSIYLSWLSLVTVIVAILGREYINYRHRVKEREKRPYFHQMDIGLKVLAVIPGTPADRLDILAGETIVKVNGQKIDSIDTFYQALQSSGAFFKLEIVDDAGENRFIQGALYEGDHHELGLIFTDKPYREKKS